MAKKCGDPNKMLILLKFIEYSVAVCFTAVVTNKSYKSFVLDKNVLDSIRVIEIKADHLLNECCP